MTTTCYDCGHRFTNWLFKKNCPVCGRDLEMSRRRAQQYPSAVPYDARRREDGGNPFFDQPYTNNVVMMGSGETKPVEATITEPSYGSWGGDRGHDYGGGCGGDNGFSRYGGSSDSGSSGSGGGGDGGGGGGGGE